ncbi:MAG: hypothetical protein SF066_11755, partial [Thermoanaerobaculia bacterium]|nr:hypothetical protein [Thermoanaerobaculia bacterium]
MIARSVVSTLLLSTTLVPVSVAAATLTVTSFASGSGSTGDCTLTEAIFAATSDTPQDACGTGAGADEVILPAVGTYSIANALLVTGTQTLTVRGNRAAGTAGSFVVDLSFLDRFLTVQNGAQVTIENLTVRNGAPHFDFGGCVVSRQASLTLRDTIFFGCEAPRGGGVYWNGSGTDRLVVERTTFQANTARFLVGAGNQMIAGALAIEANGNSSARLVDVEFLDNEVDCLGPDCASAFGGALHVFQFDTSAVTLLRTTFINNRLRFDAGEGGDGGAAMIQGGVGPTVIEDAFFSGNALEGTTFGGSALHVDTAGTSRFDRLRFIGNDLGVAARSQADIRATFGGDVEVTNVLIAKGGSLGLNLDCQGTGSTLVAGNLTVTGHTARGIQAFQGPGTSVRLDNSIVWANGNDAIETFGSPVTIDPSNFIGLDPHFVNPAVNDFELAFTSPARDNGNGALASVQRYDALHRLRIVGPAIDRGALERNALFSDGFEIGDSGAWSQTV